jgi:ATP-dependent Clp protease adapter protein ClpS
MAIAAKARANGSIKVATIRGVSVFFHWSLPAGGLLVSSFGGVDPRQWIYYCFAYTFLVIIHECGHLLAATILGLRVFSVEISGVGGLCRLERPHNVLQSVLVYSAGLFAQAATLLGTIAYIEAIGNPSGPFGRAIVITFTLVNVAMFAINLIPSKNGRSGLATDGWQLWRLCLHVFGGRPHPHPPLLELSADQAPVFPVDSSLLERPGFRPPGYVHGIEILNDRSTPMEFVVSCFVNHLGLTRDQAIARMLEIHNAGGLLIAFPTQQEANRIAAAISADARASGHKLACRYAGA